MQQVYLDASAAETFLDAARALYPSITRDNPAPCFAILLGSHSGGAVHVRQMAFGANVRATNTQARAEFAETIVPRFGAQYENPRRGWWCDPQDLLHIARRGEAQGLDVLGGAHLHPDWHRICGADQESAVLSERPTAMDEHLFQHTGWGVHLICYLARHGPGLYSTWAGWRTDPGGGTQRVPVRLGCPQPAAGSRRSETLLAATSR